MAIVAATAVAAGVLARLGRSGLLSPTGESRAVPKKTILSAWQERRWDVVRVDAISSLAKAPLDPFYLSFGGFAAFYQAMELPEGEERAALLDESITYLRKALAVASRGTPTAHMRYVLGKAYYHKGRAYYDLAAANIEAAMASGFSASDCREYLALAYAGLGDKVRAVSNFDAALAAAPKRPEQLLLAAARANLDAGSPDKAQALLEEAIINGVDELAREKCRFILGDIFRSRGEGDKAEAQYSLILDKDPESAEAYYRLGLVYQERGDPVRARAQWRKAVSLDPMHAAARQKLSEKL